MESIEFTLTAADLLDAQRLHYDNTLKSRGYLWQVGGLGVLVAVVFGYVGFKTQAGITEFAMYAALLAAWIFFMFLSRWVTRNVGLPRLARRTYFQQKDLQAPMAIGVQPPTIVLTNANARANTPTENFFKWAENKKTFLLYRSDRLFHMIPKRAMNDAFYHALKAELARAGVPRAGSKKT